MLHLCSLLFQQTCTCRRAPHDWRIGVKLIRTNHLHFLIGRQAPIVIYRTILGHLPVGLAMGDGSSLIKAIRHHCSQLRGNHKGRRNHMILRSITATIRIALVYLWMTYHIIAIGTGYLYHIHIGVRVLACARCLGCIRRILFWTFPPITT